MSIKLLFSCIICSILLAVLPFMNLPVLSTNTAFISSYGSYLSGTIAPCVALFAFWGLLKTLNLQQKQIELLTQEQKRKEIAECIEKYETLMEKAFSNHNTTLALSNIPHIKNYKLSEILSLFIFERDYKQNIKTRNEYFSEAPSEQLFIGEAIASASLYFTRMAQYIDEYRKIANDRLLIGVYYNKHQTLAKRLHERGFIDDETFFFWSKPLKKANILQQY